MRQDEEDEGEEDEWAVNAVGKSNDVTKIKNKDKKKKKFLSPQRKRHSSSSSLLLKSPQPSSLQLTPTRNSASLIKKSPFRKPHTPSSAALSAAQKLRKAAHRQLQQKQDKKQLQLKQQQQQLRKSEGGNKNDKGSSVADTANNKQYRLRDRASMQRGFLKNAKDPALSELVRKKLLAPSNSSSTASRKTLSAISVYAPAGYGLQQNVIPVKETPLYTLKVAYDVLHDFSR